MKYNCHKYILQFNKIFLLQFIFCPDELRLFVENRNKKKFVSFLEQIFFCYVVHYALKAIFVFDEKR